ncbi:hypothetical protein AB1L30_00080, partial [Bremerella sp. JC817]
MPGAGYDMYSGMSGEGMGGSDANSPPTLTPEQMAMLGPQADALLRFTQSILRSQGHVEHAELENFRAAGYDDAAPSLAACRANCWTVFRFAALSPGAC